LNPSGKFEMRIGIYQNFPEFGLVDANVEKAIEALSQLEADLMVLPELFNTGYQFISKQEVEELAEEVPFGKTCQRMITLADKRNLFLVFGLAEREEKRLYNSAAVVGPGGFVGRYRKTHLFDEEQDFFEPGDSGFHVFNLGQAKIGVMICFDWWFPESTRVLALLGADIICHPANLVLPQCQDAMCTRSLENGVFIITANRVGTESRGGKDPLAFTGKSQILDTRGQIITRLGENEAGIALTDIDPTLARNKGITTRNDRFRDRRPGFYGPLTKELRDLGI
jgi:predicted amidohydrolase